MFRPPPCFAAAVLPKATRLTVAQFDRATGLATALQRTGEARTLTQLRADAITDVLLDGVTPGGLGQGVRGTVAVMVPVLTLLGHSYFAGWSRHARPTTSSRGGLDTLDQRLLRVEVSTRSTNDFFAGRTS